MEERVYERANIAQIVAEEVMRSVNAQVEFNAGEIKIGNENYMDWKVAWKKLKNMIREGQIRKKFESLTEKRMQSEIPLGFDKEDHDWLKCNTDPRKTASIFTLQEQMIETKAWKKLRGLVDEDKCRLCGAFRETVQHLLAGCKKLAGSEYVRRHDNALKVLAVHWAIDNKLLREGTKWYTEIWEKGKVIEKMGKSYIGFGTSDEDELHGLTLEDRIEKKIMIIDMACPNESNKEKKREEKVKKYQQLCYEIRERRDGYKMKIIPVVIGCLGGGMKRLKDDVKELFENEKELQWICREMQKTVLWESETIMRKILSGLLI